MEKVVDQSGNAVPGLSRSGHGLAVVDPAGYNKYLTERQRALEVDSLRFEVNELKGMMAKILQILEK